MQRFLVLFSVLSLTFAACGGSDKKSKDANDAEQKTSMQKIEAISTDLQTGVDALMQPINDTQAVIDEITALPAKLNLDAKSLLSMASATMSSGEVSISADLNLDAKAKAEIEAILGKLKGIVEGLKATPEHVKLLLAKATSATAEVPVLATAVTSEANLTLSNPLASSDDKTKAQADIGAVANVQSSVQAKIQEVQQTLGSIPAMATEALAKLTASFAGGV